MSTNSTNGYLRYLPIVFLCGLAPAFAEIWQNFQPREEGNNVFSTGLKTVLVLGYSIPQIVIIILLSLYYNRRDALWSLLFCLIDIPLSVYYWGGSQPLFTHLLYRMVQGVPYLAWGFMMLRDQRAMPFMLMLLFPFASSWINNGGSVFYNLSILQFEVPNGAGGTFYLHPMVYTKYLFLFVLHYVFLAEFYQRAANGLSTVRARGVQLSNNYTGLQAFLLFLSYRWLILLSIIGCVSGMAFFSSTFDTFREQSTYLSAPVLIISGATSLVMFVVILYLYRKFMIEIFFQKGETPTYLYWLISIPFMGFILFLIVLLGFRDVSLTERLEKFRRAVTETGSHLTIIRVFIIVGQVLSMLAMVFMYANRPDVLILLLGLIVSVCTIFYLYNRSLIYVIFALFLVKMIAMGLDADHYFQSYMTGWALILNSLFDSGLGFYTMFYLAGTLHIDHFDAEEESNNVQLEDDSDLAHFAPEIG